MRSRLISIRMSYASIVRRGGINKCAARFARRLGPPWARTDRTGGCARPMHVRSPTFDVLPGALRLHLLFGFSS